MRIREARPSDAHAIAKVHVDSWRTTYVDILPSEFLDSLSYAERERWWSEVLSPYKERTSVYVAEDENGAVVGFASGGAEREGDAAYLGELYAIYLLESQQRRGIGRRLTMAVACRLLERGFDSMLLWVLTDNPACKFYEALGAKRIGEKTIAIGGVEVIEVAYGWRNLQELIESHG